MGQCLASATDSAKDHSQTELVASLKAEIAAIKAAQIATHDRVAHIGHELRARAAGANAVDLSTGGPQPFVSDPHAFSVSNELGQQEGEADWQARMEAEVEALALLMDRAATVIQAAGRGSLARALVRGRHHACQQEHKHHQQQQQQQRFVSDPYENPELARFDDEDRNGVRTHDDLYGSADDEMMITWRDPIGDAASGDKDFDRNPAIHACPLSPTPSSSASDGGASEVAEATPEADEPARDVIDAAAVDAAAGADATGSTTKRSTLPYPRVRELDGRQHAHASRLREAQAAPRTLSDGILIVDSDDDDGLPPEEEDSD